MPLTVDGSATYNIANLAGAALAAIALGIAPTEIASVFATFGARSSDNLGRMMRFDVGGVRVVLDYAHNADGLRGLLRVAEHLRATPATGVSSGPRGRLALLLGHAGNRQNEDIEDLARIAAEFNPDLVVVKENEGHLRGREPGEVPRIIRAALLRAGLPESAVPLRMSEVEAARCALDWARPGDVVTATRALSRRPCRGSRNVGSTPRSLAAAVNLPIAPLPAPRVVEHFHIPTGLRVHKPLPRDLPVAVERGIPVVVAPALEQSADDKNRPADQDLDPARAHTYGTKVGTQCQRPESKYQHRRAQHDQLTASSTTAVP